MNDYNGHATNLVLEDVPTNNLGYLDITNFFCGTNFFSTNDIFFTTNIYVTNTYRAHHDYATMIDLDRYSQEINNRIERLENTVWWNDGFNCVACLLLLVAVIYTWAKSK